jgi:hypothetical protein
MIPPIPSASSANLGGEERANLLSNLKNANSCNSRFWSGIISISHISPTISNNIPHALLISQAQLTDNLSY